MLIISVLILLITGCSQQEEEKIRYLKEEVGTILETTEKLSNRVQVLEQNNQTLLNLIDEQVTILSESLDEKYFTLPIYHTDIETYDVRIQYYVMIQKDLSLEEKVQTLANKLSIYSFSGAPIELLKIETLDNGERIAIINLVDSDIRTNTSFEKKWATNYLQGSAGGYATTSKLTRTFLQKNIEGEWINGVKFLYNSDETNIFQHAGEFFGKIHYRD